MRLLAVSTLSLAAMTGCELFGIPTTIDLPVPLNTPPVEIDVTAAVAAGLDQACDDEDSPSCETIGLICRAETGDACAAGELPNQFPREIDVDGNGESVDVEEILPEELTEAGRLKFAIPVDLTDALENGGVNDPDQVKNVSVDDLAINWTENSLSFDAPVLDVYIGPKDSEGDPDDLIDDAAFIKVGSIGKDLDEEAAGFEVGQEAGVTGAVPLTFIAGGNDAFNEALRSLAFTLVLVAPSGQELRLKDVPNSDPQKVAKPGGKAEVRLEATLVYSVDLAGAASDVGDAID